jgi:hypothetical protein
MDFETSPRQHLEERFAVVVQRVEVLVGQVVDIAVGEPFSAKETFTPVGIVAMDSNDLAVAKYLCPLGLVIHR